MNSPIRRKCLRLLRLLNLESLAVEGQGRVGVVFVANLLGDDRDFPPKSDEIPSISSSKMN